MAVEGTWHWYGQAFTAAFNKEIDLEEEGKLLVGLPHTRGGERRDPGTGGDAGAGGDGGGG